MPETNDPKQPAEEIQALLKPQPQDGAISEEFRTSIAGALQEKKQKDDAISEEFRTAIAGALQEKKKRTPPAPPKRSKFEMQLDRHEAKFVINPALLPKIREFIRPFCEPDPNGVGTPPEYTITTLQLDTPDYALHHAKDHERVARFKLRVRTYGTPGDAPAFMEIKRKVRGSIMKSRCRVPFESWNEKLVHSVRHSITFRSSTEETAFLEFMRLTREIGARPVALIRYIRESYFGVHDSYARVTFDRKLEYQPTDSWDDWGRSGRWMSIDSCFTQNKAQRFSGIVLELKTLSDAPLWMIDLVEYFNLERTGHCKYSNAVWKEAMFSGGPQEPGYMNDFFGW